MPYRHKTENLEKWNAFVLRNEEEITKWRAFLGDSNCWLPVIWDKNIDDYALIITVSEWENRNK